MPQWETGSDHVIWGPMRGLEKNPMGRGQTNTHSQGQTLWLLDRIGLVGRFSEKYICDLWTWLCRFVALQDSLLLFSLILGFLNIPGSVAFISLIAISWFLCMYIYSFHFFHYHLLVSWHVFILYRTNNTFKLFLFSLMVFTRVLMMGFMKRPCRGKGMIYSSRIF